MATVARNAGASDPASGKFDSTPGRPPKEAFEGYRPCWPPRHGGAQEGPSEVSSRDKLGMLWAPARCITRHSQNDEIAHDQHVLPAGARRDRTLHGERRGGAWTRARLLPHERAPV